MAPHWTPTAQAYRGLGQLYVDDERFSARYEQIAPGLAAYQRDAMIVYARDGPVLDGRSWTGLF